MNSNDKLIELSPKLLTQLRRLVELDNYYEFSPDAPEPYRERALILQSLGLHSIAKYENRLYAEKEHLINKETYNLNYDDSFNLSRFEHNYILEKETFYYKKLSILIKIDHHFLNPISPKKIIERAGSLALLGLFNLALRDYDFVLSHLGKDSEYYSICCLNKSYILNIQGKYEIGLSLYEERWNTNEVPFKNKIQFPCPRWNGQHFTKDKGKLLIHREQGIGDNIQFIRYAILLKLNGVDIIVWNNDVIDDFLKFNLSLYNITCVEPEQTENLAYEIPMMSLPYIMKTRVDNITMTNKYLYASPDYIEKWRLKLNLLKTKLNIGFVFRSRDKKLRNIDIHHFTNLFSFDAQFHCLQKDIKSEELEILNQYSNVVTYHTEIHSFLDTSAIIEHLDLIISIDTCVAHLSAAMGKSTWILLNYAPDFRWLLNREDSIWYNSVRLFRQDLDYKWENVIHNVYYALNYFDTGK